MPIARAPSFVSEGHDHQAGLDDVDEPIGERTDRHLPHLYRQRSLGLRQRSTQRGLVDPVQALESLANEAGPQANLSPLVVLGDLGKLLSSFVV